MKLFSCALALAVLPLARGGDAGWQREVTPPTVGDFASLSGLRMHFRFGWSNVIEAAKADAVIQRTGGCYQVHVSGGSRGLARALWPLDAQHSALIDATTLRPVRIAQLERYRTRTIETQVRFDATGLDRLRKPSNPNSVAKWKRVNFTPIFDVLGGVLFVRSQPLRVGDRIGVVCFPGDSPYLAVVRVEKRERVRCMGRDWPALRLSLTVRKIETKSGRLTDAVAYSKFRSGTVWVSDDSLRLPLRAEVHVMIGFVYGELSGFELL
ncbi:MAG: DUF3108 domain-containing protein [Terrimicrobiaceae bacterium]|nr:DUF3108 domain-containing protein [Terrimicrobiaceae bacterium]